MTFEEYAVKNLKEMKAREPTSQNMRDVALLEIWLNMNAAPNQIERLTESVTQNKPILPAFQKYVEAKEKYQTKDTTKDKVLETLGAVSREIKSFILSLYNNTDTQEERNLLDKFFKNIK
jgi:hypothetical protein